MGCDQSRDGEVKVTDEVVAPMSREVNSKSRDLFKRLLAYFDKVDTNNDKKLSRKEFDDALHADLEIEFLIKLSGGFDSFAFMQIDLDGGGEISRAEWGHIVRKAYCLRLFDEIDTDKSGQISRGELAQKMNMDCAVQNLMKDYGLSTEFFVFEQFDEETKIDGENKDGLISKNEWLKVLLRKPVTKEEHKDVLGATKLSLDTDDNKAA